MSLRRIFYFGRRVQVCAGLPRYTHSSSKRDTCSDTFSRPRISLSSALDAMIGKELAAQSLRDSLARLKTRLPLCGWNNQCSFFCVCGPCKLQWERDYNKLLVSRRRVFYGTQWQGPSLTAAGSAKLNGRFVCTQRGDFLPSADQWQPSFESLGPIYYPWPARAPLSIRIELVAGDGGELDCRK